MDISAAGDGWNSSNAYWHKKCCNPLNGYPVIPLPSDVPDERIPAINSKIRNMVQLTEVNVDNYFYIHFCSALRICRLICHYALFLFSGLMENYGLRIDDEI